MSEALRLAEYLEYIPDQINREAAAELRRLDGLVGDLVEALRVAVKLNSFREFNDHIPAMKAALAKAEGNV